MDKYADTLKAVFVSSLGGSLEMYDFVIYVFFAPVIASLFFPAHNTTAGTFFTYGIFAIGYLARPLGAFIFGHYGDKHSCKQGLIVTIGLMSLATALTGLLPTYQQIGILAPVLLLFLRLIQGIAVGGDLAGAVTFVAEYSEPTKRGFHCGWIYSGVNLGALLASTTSAILNSALSHQQIAAWGWRLSFSLSIILMFVGVY